MSWSGVVTVVAGGWIWFDMYRLNLPGGWRGMMLAVGALAGLVAVGVGHGVQSPNARKMAKLSGEMAGADGPPDPDLVASVNALRERMGKTAMFLAWALAIGVAGMALGGS